MHIEIAQAVEFLGRLLGSKLDEETVNGFKDKLTQLLKNRFKDHWDPQQPYKGNAYRALSNFNGQLDPILCKASLMAAVSPSTILAHLPNDFVLWIDPFSVSYKVGDFGNIMTLFEDRSRGRITFKLDPSNSPKKSNSPNNSPMMQYLQPRASTPIRISPPSSPENTLIKGHVHQSSPLSKEDQSDGKGEHQLVMAN